jgi:hypothetical protein
MIRLRLSGRAVEEHRVPRRPEIYLLLASLGVSLALGEVVVRMALPEVPPSLVAISSPHFLLDARGAVRHTPNETIRMVSLYDTTIEFDITYQTNNLGLVDHRDYPVDLDSRFHYAFVGNSFTYGMGADPWVPRLRDTLRARRADLELYNLGVNGASILHFRALLSSFAEEMPLTHIVLIPISNDFYRPWWVPVPSPSGMRLCRHPPDCGNAPLFPLMDHDATYSALVRWNREQQAARASRQEVTDPWWKRALWHSQLYLLARRGLRGVYRHVVGHEPEPDVAGLEQPQLLGPNLDALAGIRTDFPELPITLAHFPQIEEVRAGRYTLELADPVSERGIDYFPALTRCDWSPEMFHRVNAHPNAAGYENFAQCLSQYLLGDTR